MEREKNEQIPAKWTKLEKWEKGLSTFCTTSRTHPLRFHPRWKPSTFQLSEADEVELQSDPSWDWCFPGPLNSPRGSSVSDNGIDDSLLPQCPHYCCHPSSSPQQWSSCLSEDEIDGWVLSVFIKTVKSVVHNLLLDSWASIRIQLCGVITLSNFPQRWQT